MENLSENQRVAIKALEEKYGSVEFYKKNNEVLVTLPDGEPAPIKTGNRGTILQITDSEKYDARYKGAAQDAKTVIIAIRNREGEKIRVYEVPGDEYRSQLRNEYVQRVEERDLNETKLRILHFDNKGYPEQRVAEKWKEFLIYQESTDNQHETQPTPAMPISENDETLEGTLEKAKKIFARITKIPEEEIEIAINIKK